MFYIISQYIIPLLYNSSLYCSNALRHRSLSMYPIGIIPANLALHRSMPYLRSVFDILFMSMIA